METYAKPSRARIMSLKESLRNLKKGNLSITSYLQKIKQNLQHFSLSCIQVSVDELFLHAHRGLPSEYDTITSALTGSVSMGTRNSNPILFHMDFATLSQITACLYMLNLELCSTSLYMLMN
ncbi:hypothetical protein KY289_008078 [Solanum tuberosum]|nr:hypothetical protein KY289_008078 [Solanum tuberosum]